MFTVWVNCSFGSILILCSLFSCTFLVVCVPMEQVSHLGKKSLFSGIKVSTQGREKSRRIKYSWNHIGTREKVHLFFLLRRLSFSRFSLTIKTLATDVSLGEEKKSFILIFSFVIMAVNCWKIHHFSLIERVIDGFLA